MPLELLSLLLAIENFQDFYSRQCISIARYRIFQRMAIEEPFTEWYIDFIILSTAMKIAGNIWVPVTAQTSHNKIHSSSSCSSTQKTFLLTQHLKQQLGFSLRLVNWSEQYHIPKRYQLPVFHHQQPEKIRTRLITMNPSNRYYLPTPRSY